MGKGKEKLHCVVLLEIQREGGCRGGRMRSEKDRRKMEVWGSMRVGISTGNGQCYVYLGKRHRMSTYEGNESGVWRTARGPSSETYTRENGLSSISVLRYHKKFTGVGLVQLWQS